MRPRDRVSAWLFERARTAWCLAVGCTLLLGHPVPALAHGGLRSSSPARGEVVTTQLRELRLEFVEAPELAFTSVKLIGPAGTSVTVGRPSLTERTIVIQLPVPLSPGSYAVSWKTAGRDGHPVTGEFPFSVAAIATASGITEGGSSPKPAAIPPMRMHHDSVSMPTGRSFDSASPGYVAIRWAQLMALVTLIGAFAFRYVVLGILRRRHASSPFPGGLHDRISGIARLAAWTLALLAAARLIAQSYAMHGENEPVLSMMLPMITGTTWGAGWLLQVVGCGVVIAGLGLARRGRMKGWEVASVGALALAFTPALSGHAASSPQLSPLAVLSDAIHVTGAGGWLGSLLFVLLVGIPAAMQLEQGERSAAVASLVNAFSPAALVFAGITATTGVFAAWLHVGSIPGLWETQYGRTLLLKLGILSVVAATGAYNWRRVKPALGKPESTARLKRSATFELAVAVMILAVTAVLVATPTAMDEEMMRPTISASPLR